MRMSVGDFNEAIAEGFRRVDNDGVQMLTSDGNNYSWNPRKFDKTITFKLGEKIGYFDIPEKMEYEGSANDIANYVSKKEEEVINIIRNQNESTST